MRYSFTAIILSVILMSGVLGAPAFSQGIPLTVETDASSYSGGERMTVTVTALNKLSGFGMTIQLFSSTGNLLAVAQGQPDDEGVYSKVISINPSWKDGDYIVKAVYGNLQNSVDISIGESSGSIGTTPPQPSMPENVIPVAGTDETVMIDITGGSVSSITPDIDTKSLIVQIISTDDGILTLTLPKTVIDATDGNGLIVLIDNEQREFEVSDDSTSRVLKIPFFAGDETIEIIGTFVIPEFGSIAIIVLAVSVIAIIGLTIRSRSSMPFSN